MPRLVLVCMVCVLTTGGGVGGWGAGVVAGSGDGGSSVEVRAGEGGGVAGSGVDGVEGGWTWGGSVGRGGGCVAARSRRKSRESSAGWGFVLANGKEVSSKTT